MDRKDRQLSSHRLWVGGSLCALGLLALTITLAVISRPLPREALPKGTDELRNELAARHRGPPEECARWPVSAKLSRDRVDTLLIDLETVFIIDLHTILRFFAAVRQTNREAERQAHTTTPDDEFVQTLIARLGPIDRLRFTLREDELAEGLPRIEGLAPDPVTESRDRHRATVLRRWLDDDEVERLDTLVSRWRVPLASATAQASVIDVVGNELTRERLRLLRAGLAEFRLRFGRYPADLVELLEHRRRTNQLSPALERAVERDGSVRDGWLRHFEYYRIGVRGYRLRSEGPSSDTETDDIVVDTTARR